MVAKKLHFEPKHNFFNYNQTFLLEENWVWVWVEIPLSILKS